MALKPRWSKIASDLWDDKTRTGLVVASIAAGVFALGMIISAFVILNEDVNRSYAAANPPNIEITTGPFQQDFVRAVRKIPGVRQVEGRRVIEMRARQGGGAWRYLRLIAVPAAPAFPGAINHLALIEGRLIPAAGELVVAQDATRISGFRPGQRLEIELPGLSPRYLTVAGLVGDQTMARSDQNTTINAYTHLETLAALGLDGYLDRLYVTIDGDGGDEAAIAAVAQAIEDQVERSRRSVYQSKQYCSVEHPGIKGVLAIMGALGALGLMITVLSSSLIINTLNAMLAQQLRQIGIMKLVGGRSRQILAMYLALIVAYGLAALLVGVPLSALAGYSLAGYIARLMGAALQGFRLVPAALAAQVLIALLLPLGAGYLPVHAGARTSVLSAINRDRAAPLPRRDRPSRPGGAAPLPRPLLLSFRNTFRKKGRLGLTIFTLSVAGGVFIAVFNTRDSINKLLDQLMEHFLSDVSVDLRQPYRVERVVQALQEVDGVVAAEGWGGASGEIWDARGDLVTEMLLLAPPQDTQLLHPQFVAGRWLLPGEEAALVISDSIYQYYPALQPGDRLRVKLPGRRAAGWTVVGVFRFVDMLGEPMAYANDQFIASQLHQRGQAASFRVATRDHDPATQQALTRRIDDHLQRRNIAVRGVQSGYLLRQNATQAINTLVAFLLIMAALTAFVGSIGLMGTMSINVLERTREIGVMRTIGAVDRVIMQAVMVEALVIGLLTWLLAVGLSFPISVLLLAILGEAMTGAPFALSITPLGMLIWLGVVVLLSLFASLVPARRAARLTINEVLAYE